MMRLVLISILLLFSAVNDGRKSVREGNRAFEEGDYERAAENYRAALGDAAGGGSEFALHHNLGAALFRLGRTDEALDHFKAAGATAYSPEAAARAAYNAGNAALAAEDFGAAADLFQEALRLQPDNEDARFNYEYARRRVPPESESDEGMTDQNEDEESAGEGDENDSDEPEKGDDEEEESTTPEDEGDPQEDALPEPSESEEADDQQSDESPSDGQPEELTQEQAEQILGALQHGEERLLREIQQAPHRARHVEKDW